MILNSYFFFTAITVIIVSYNLCHLFFNNKLVNNLVILVANIFILLQLMKINALALLSTFTVVVWVCGVLLQKRRSKICLGVVLSIVILLFCIRNYPSVQNFMGSIWNDTLEKPFLSVEKIGLSYILFRVIHWLVESYNGTIRSRNFLLFFNYLFFFPNFLAGPIDTFNNFHYWMQKKITPFHKRLFFAGISRIFIGACKLLLLVPLIKPYSIDYHLLIPNFSPVLAVFLSALIYSCYILLDFSGYCDVAIGMAYTIGVKTPENFNYPYLANNIALFWKRWHITFSSFLFKYVFKPFIKLLNHFSIRKYRMGVSVTAYIFTFTVCGLWHGNTFNFLLWGLWHGVGLSLYKIFRYIRPLKCEQSFINKVLGTIFTFIFVSFGWIFFNYSYSELVQIFNLFFYETGL